MWHFLRSGKNDSSGSIPDLATQQGAPGQQQQRQGRTRASKLEKLMSRVISFKDLRISVEHTSIAEDGAAGPPGSQTRASTLLSGQPPRVAVEKNKLVIIMVGLPARGKTFLCNKLLCYLNWLGHPTAHFNVGQYRRKQKHDDEMQNAAFFDHHNPAGMAAREKAFQAALADMLDWINQDRCQVAIFDATNSTNNRRQKLVAALKDVVKFIFIESICNDPTVLHTNYLNKMRYSPDYSGCDMQQAVDDFIHRIRKYEEVYEPITDRSMHYIKLTDMVTGRGHIDINRISGYLPGKIVFFLMQVCKSGMTNARKIWLTRHGESLYNQRALIGGDSDLSPYGEAYSKVLPEVITSRVPAAADGSMVPISVWTSTLKRTIQTAQHLPFAKLKWKALDEIDAGICDGLTYAQIEERFPEEFLARKKDKLRYRYPRGESYLDMIQRLEPVITEMEREGQSIVIVAHQAVLRILYGYLTARPQEEIPSLSIPLHTVIELTPMPDGTNSVEYIPVPVSATGLEASFTEAPPAGLILPAGAELTPSLARMGPTAVQASGASNSGSAWQQQQQQEGGGVEKEDLRRLCSCSSRHSLMTHITASSVVSLGGSTAAGGSTTEPLLQPAAVVEPASC